MTLSTWQKVGLVAGGLVGLKLWWDAQTLAARLKDAASAPKSLNSVGGIPVPTPTVKVTALEPTSWKVMENTGTLPTKTSDYGLGWEG